MLAEKKRTNKWLAEQLGKDPATISKWVTNASQPSLENLIEISKLLEVDIKELLVSEYKKSYLLPQEGKKEISQGL
jgi:transcriptional regulator with XRE-family HTH domain